MEGLTGAKVVMSSEELIISNFFNIC
jgi:hypothetical protein